MEMKLQTNLIIIISVLFFSCKQERTIKNENKITSIIKSKNKSQEKINISILLDLSDRIDSLKYPNPTMQFYQRDLGYISAITKAYENHVMGKKTRSINDKIQMFVEPAPSDPELNSKIAKLKTHFHRNNATRESIIKTTNIYRTNCEAIYKKAIAEGKYIGSDIFDFFKNKIANYCIENDYRNILIILTDGYVFHKDFKIKEKGRTSYITPKTIKTLRLNTNNWKNKFEKKDYGFLKISRDLENLEVLILGVNPDKRNPYEGDVIQAYWEKWLKEMKVKKHAIKRADLPIHLEDVIQEFIIQ